MTGRSGYGGKMAAKQPQTRLRCIAGYSEKASEIKTDHVRARSSNWIEQGTPKPKVASSILAGRTNLLGENWRSRKCAMYALV